MLVVEEIVLGRLDRRDHQASVQQSEHYQALLLCGNKILQRRKLMRIHRCLDEVFRGGVEAQHRGHDDGMTMS